MRQSSEVTAKKSRTADVAVPLIADHCEPTGCIKRLFRIILVAGLLHTLAGAVTGQSKVVARASIAAQKDVLVGQRVTYRLEVLASDGWASLPKPPRLEVSAAIVFSLPGQGVRLTETIDGESYSGQRYEMWLYPQRAGEFAVPELPIDVAAKQFGANAKSTLRQSRTKSVTFRARLPAGVSISRGFVCTRQFSGVQTWQPEQTKFQIGDGLQRSLSRTIADAPGMVLPVASHDEIPGVRSYTKQPTVNDSINRGEITGHRAESVTYVFERPGEFKLPDVIFEWWDLEAKELKHETLPGRTVVVTADPRSPPVATEPETPRSESRSLAPLIAVALISLISALGLWWYRETLAQTWREWSQQLANSEWASFPRFLRAARSNNAAAVLRMLMRWLDGALGDAGQPARLDKFLDEYGEPASQRAGALLVEAAQSDGQTEWDGRDLVVGIRQARKRLQALSAPVKRRSSNLPEINPQLSIPSGNQNSRQS